MEHITEELSEIAFALHKIAADLHFARRPSWDEVAEHIASNRFPEKGLKLNGNAVGRSVRRILAQHDPNLLYQPSAELILPGRPELLLRLDRDYSNPQLGFREIYRVLFIDPNLSISNTSTQFDYLEGLVAIGSPSDLRLFVQVRENPMQGRLTRIRDYPGNTMPATVENRRKSITIRAHSRIGLK